MSHRSDLTRRKLIATAAAILPAGLALRAVAADMQTLTGEVVYRERIALPPGNVTRVDLLDVSRADAMADQISQQTIAGATGSPIPYQLQFDPSLLQPGRRYSVRAQITVEGELLFTSTTHYPVLDGTSTNTTIQVQMIARHTTPDMPGPAGDWLAEDIRGGGVIDNLQSVLSIAPDGALSGSTGCNRLVGNATITGDAISFGALGVTRMACVPAAMDQEQKFLSALTETRRFQIVPQESKLLLFNESGAQILRLARNEP